MRGLLRLIFAAPLLGVLGRAEAASLDWRGSIATSAIVSGVDPTQRKSTTLIADVRLVASDSEFTLFIPGYPDLTGTVSSTGKKSNVVKLLTDQAATAWSAFAIQILNATTVQVITTTGSGTSDGATGKLTLHITGKTRANKTVKAQVKLVFQRVHSLGSVQSSVTSAAAEIGNGTVGTATVEANFFTSPATVSLEYRKEPVSTPLGGVAATPTLVATLPADAVAPSDVSGSSPAILFRPLWAASPAKSASTKASVATLARLAVSWIDSAGSALSQQFLYARPGSTIRLPRELLGAPASGTPSIVRVALTEFATSTLLPSVSTTLYHWNADIDSFELVSKSYTAARQADLQDKQIVVFIHGWQFVPDTNSVQPQIDTWSPILQWAVGRDSTNANAAANRQAYEFYSVRYDSKLHVYDNAVAVHSLLSHVFAGRSITVVAHSMGGLVAHAMIHRYYPASIGAASYGAWSGGIARLITLDTPFHGTPIVQSATGNANCGPVTDVLDGALGFLLVDTPGVRDLRWDGADGNFGDPNTDLAALNAQQDGVDTRYRAFSGQIDSSNNAHGVYGFLERRLESCGAAYSGDGVVPVESATLVDFHTSPPIARVVRFSSIGYTVDLDHTQVAEGRNNGAPDQPHFDNILAQLPPPLEHAESQLAASDGAPGDAFGSAVAMQGDTAVVAAPESDGKKGAVYVYSFANNAWTQNIELKTSLPTGTFGSAIALDGDTLIVGSSCESNAKGSFAGAAYVYSRGPSGWSAAPTTRLLADDGYEQQRFGDAAAIGGGHVLIGAYQSNVVLASTSSGAGVVYSYSQGDASGVPDQRLIPSSPTTSGHFGFSISIDRDTAVIGAPALGGTGFAYVYQWNGSAWAQVQMLTSEDDRDAFGWCVSVQDDLIVVGAPTTMNAARSHLMGAAYVFERQLGSWGLKAKLLPIKPRPDDEFGINVALDGDRVFVDQLQDTGCLLHIYDRSGDVWTEGPIISTSHSLTVTTRPGPNVSALSGSRLIVGNVGGAGGAGEALILRVP